MWEILEMEMEMEMGVVSFHSTSLLTNVINLLLEM